MGADGACNGADVRPRHVLEDGFSAHCVQSNNVHLRRIQRPWIIEQLVGNTELSDVVQECIAADDAQLVPNNIRGKREIFRIVQNPIAMPGHSSVFLLKKRSWKADDARIGSTVSLRSSAS
jgi:uncharacterized Fe-S cluster protein YjdI